MTIHRVAVSVALALFSSSIKSQPIATSIGVPQNHCSVEQSAPDGRTSVCMVWDDDPQLFSNPLELEIYRNQQIVVTIKTGIPIQEWHFWKKGKQLIKVLLAHSGYTTQPQESFWRK